MIVSVKEARELLGDDCVGMTDDEVEQVILTLDDIAKDALQQARIKIARKRDAKALAELTYDMYQEQKRKKNSKKQTQ